MNTTISSKQHFDSLLRRFKLHRGMAFGIIIIAALLAFEIFNYSTTEFAISDLLGDLSFLGIRWATILAIAFCGIDFAGIARLFTPGEGHDEVTEVWYLFGAWLLAATMNAMLTWWGVSIAILNHESLGNAVIARETLIRAVPIFVAVMVWLIRVLIIGTFSVAGNRLFTQDDNHVAARAPRRTISVPNTRVINEPQMPVAPRTNGASASMSSARPAPKPTPNPESIYTRPEPTYHPASMSAKSPRNSNSNPRM
jgi:hypothetical protein